jgi:signal transduction histidine kinase
MSSPQSRTPLYARRGWVVRAAILQYVLLTALLPSALGGSWGSLQVNLLLCLTAAAWNLLALLPALRESPPARAVFVAGVIVIAFVLVIRDPWFAFYAYTGYAYAALLLPWPWLLAGLAPTAVVSATGQTNGVQRWTPAGLAVYLAVIASNMIVSGGIAWIVHRIARQNIISAQMLDELREANQRLEVALAENAGLQRQLLTQAREAGVLDERQRMAREIHDTLAQGLTGIITQLQAAEGAAGEPVQWRGHHDAAISLARESLTEARRSVDALRPEPLEAAPLSEALAGVAARWSSRHGVPASVTTTGTPRPLAADVEDALLRAAQEALANVAKHAQATRVGVTVSYLEDEVALDVVDDGQGFALACGPSRPAGTGGFGLIGMRQRIERLAGTLQIESEPGAGTGISAHIPDAATGSGQ